MRWPFRGKRREVLGIEVSSNANQNALVSKPSPRAASSDAGHSDRTSTQSVSLAALQALDRLTVIEHESASTTPPSLALSQRNDGLRARRRATSEPATNRTLLSAGREPTELPWPERGLVRVAANSARTSSGQGQPLASSERERTSLYSPSGSETDEESVSSDSTEAESLTHLVPPRDDPARATSPSGQDDRAECDTAPERPGSAAGRTRAPAGSLSSSPTSFAAAWSQRRGPRLESPNDLWRMRSAAWATDTGTLVGPLEASDGSSSQTNGRTISATTGAVLQATQSYAAVRGRTPYPTSFLERRSRSRSRRSRSSSDAGRSMSPRGRAGIRSRDEFLHQLKACAQPLYDGRNTTLRYAQAIRQRVDTMNDLVDWVETQPDAFAPDASVYSAVIILVYEHLATREPPSITDEERLALADDEVFVAQTLPRTERILRTRTPSTRAESTESTDPHWQQVECAYALLLEFLDPERRDTEVKQQRVAGLVAVSPTSRIDLWERLVPHVLRLFNAPAYEREYVKTCLHRMYARFRDLRTLIRGRISVDLCLPYRFDTRAYGHLVRGLADLLSIVALIVRGLAVPLKTEHADFYRHALMPLHVPDGYVVYAAELMECAIQFATRAPMLAIETVRYLLRHWPVSHTRKEILYLDEMAVLLERWQQRRSRSDAGASLNSATPTEMQLVQLVFRRLALCMTSAHRDVAEEALLLLLENEPSRGRGTLYDDDHDDDDDDDDDKGPNSVSQWYHEAGARRGERDLAPHLKRDELSETPRSWFRRMLLQYRGFTFSVLAEAIHLNARHWDARIQQMTRQVQTLLMGLDANTYESCLRQRRTRTIERSRQLS